MATHFGDHGLFCSEQEAGKAVGRVDPPTALLGIGKRVHARQVSADGEILERGCDDDHADPGFPEQPVEGLEQRGPEILAQGIAGIGVVHDETDDPALMRFGADQSHAVLLVLSQVRSGVGSIRETGYNSKKLNTS